VSGGNLNTVGEAEALEGQTRLLGNEITSSAEGGGASNRADDGTSDSSVGKAGDTDVDGGLVRAVGEVVVPGGDELEAAGLDNGGHVREVGGGHAVGVADTVQELAGQGIVSVVVGGQHQGGAVAVLGLLSEPSKLGKIGSGEDGVGRVEGGKDVVGVGVDGNDVDPVSAIEALTGIAVVVVVGETPLEVNEVSHSGVEDEGHKVILVAVPHLGNVSTLAADVDVVDGLDGKVGGPLHNGEGVGAVLEGAAILGGVQGHTEGHGGVGGGGVAAVSVGVDWVVLELVVVVEAEAVRDLQARDECSGYVPDDRRDFRGGPALLCS